MPEFTGERVIPGLVDADLLNEHLARYRFAEQFRNGPALDIGCGTGYGTADVGVDVSREAVSYARMHFEQARFLQASADALPFTAESFELVTAFEVIEHLDRCPEFLAEARRVLKPGGVLLVSTPNKAYSAQMRAKSGPNPFHVHEFEYGEFEAALYAVFPHVRIWAQNHVSAITFAPLNPGSARLEAEGDPHPENAHFFLAACSGSPIEYGDLFAWMPGTGNVLRERELHIARLEGELAQKDKWLAELKADHVALHGKHEAALAEVKERSLWAQRVSEEVVQRDARILELQKEVSERLRWAMELGAQVGDAQAAVNRLEAELQKRTEWARSVEQQLETRTRHVQIQKDELDGYKAAWAAQNEQLDWLRKQILALEAERTLIAKSKWVRLGKSLSLGPVVTGKDGD
jgi:SAM-dependent methyltransferase